MPAKQHVFDENARRKMGFDLTGLLVGPVPVKLSGRVPRVTAGTALRLSFGSQHAAPWFQSELLLSFGRRWAPRSGHFDSRWVRRGDDAESQLLVVIEVVTVQGVGTQHVPK